MTPSMWISLAIIALPLGQVMRGRWRIDLAAFAMMAALGLGQFFGLGLLGEAGRPQDAVLILAGFSQPVIITLIGLFVLAQALTANGMIQWIGLQLSRLGKQSETRLVFLFSLTAALLSLLMNNVAVGALLLPGVMQVARRAGIAPSKLLLPIAFGTSLGGMATYFTTANIVLSNLLLSASPPQAGLNFQSFFPVGSLIAVSGILYLTFIGRRLLPSREPGLEQALARRTSDEIEGYYSIGERLWEGRVLPRSPLIGQSLKKTRIGELLGLVVVAIWRKKQAIFNPSPDETIQPDDILVVIGNEQRVGQLAQWGIEIGREKSRQLSGFDARLVEIILAPRSNYEGKTLKEMNFRRKYGFTAVALWRRGRSFRTDVGDMPLEPGDSLLLIGPPARLRDLQINPDILLLEPEAPVPNVPRKRSAVERVDFAGGHCRLADGAAHLSGRLVRRSAHPADRAAAHPGGLPRHRVAGHLLHCRDVRGQPGDGQHRPGGLRGRKRHPPVPEHSGGLGLGRGGVPAFGTAHPVHRQPGRRFRDWPHRHQHGFATGHPPAGDCGGFGHRVFGFVPDPHFASGQRDYDEPGQLPLWRFPARRLGADGGDVRHAAGGHGRVLAVISASAVFAYRQHGVVAAKPKRVARAASSMFASRATLGT